jgi:hypothetical protein
MKRVAVEGVIADGFLRAAISRRDDRDLPTNGGRHHVPPRAMARRRIFFYFLILFNLIY